MTQTLRRFAIAGVYIATVFGTLLVLMTIGTFIRNLRHGLPWTTIGLQLRTMTYLPLGYWTDPLLWIGASAAFYLFGLGRTSPGILPRAALTAIGLTLGLYAIILPEEFFWPTLRASMSPFDHPWLAAPVFIYTLLAPWIVGWRQRIGRASHREVITP